jgi:CheY-like chemotaxis protein
MAKVMLVEDDNNLREIYEARMQAEGYDVCTASDGEQALVVAKAEKPELVISDVMMPKISGFEMLDILRNTDGLQAVKVIMLTALGQADDQQRADRLGADRYLVKSQVTLEDIVNVAHQLLGDAPAPEPAPETAAAVAAVAPVAPVMAAPEPVAAPVAMVAEPVVLPVTVAAPMAVEPVVEPVSAPTTTGFSAMQVEPSAPVEPVTTAAIVIAPATDDIQSTAQEEAAVEAQIEDFVSNTTNEAPAVVEPTVEPVAPVATEQEAANAAADDQLMANAVDALSSSAAETAAPLPGAEPVIQPLAIEAAPVVAEVPVAPVATPVVDSSAPVSAPAIAGKKIISPMSSADVKPDINELLAREDAKEILAAAAAVPAVASPPEAVAVEAASDAAPTLQPAPAAIAVTPESIPAPTAVTSEATPVAAPAVQAPAVATPPVDPSKPDPSSIAL